jgi:hypothetical protein
MKKMSSKKQVLGLESAFHADLNSHAQFVSFSTTFITRKG